jgi:hypothetical protein
LTAISAEAHPLIFEALRSSYDVTSRLDAAAAGRLLVCGDATSGQCGQSYMKQRCCWHPTDMGPELGWHGLTRPTAAEVAAAGGDLAEALPKVGVLKCSTSFNVVLPAALVVFELLGCLSHCMVLR